MSKPLPQNVSAELLRSLNIKELVLCIGVFGIDAIARKLADGATDDIEGWQHIVNKIQQAEAQRTAAK